MKSVTVVFLILLTGCRFGVPRGSTKNWVSSDNPGHLYARFEALNGKQSFNLKLQRGNKAYMARKIMCSNGTLKVSVRSGNRIVAEQQIEHLVDDTLWLASNRDYRVTFTGRNASGNFDIKYRTK